MSERLPHPAVRNAAGADHWRRSQRRRYASGAERHDELVVLLGLQGAAEYLLDGEVVALTPGVLLWALAGQAHALLSDSADFDMWVFVVSRVALPPVGGAGAPPFGQGGVAPGPRRLVPAAVAELHATAEGIARLEAPGYRRAGYAYWLARAWTLWTAAPAGTGRRLHPAVERAARALQADPGLSMGALARGAGLSAGRLGQLFRAETGKGVVEMRTETRLARVDRRMEEDARADLLTAALDAGFGSYSQFYRAFRQARAMNPRRYYASEGAAPAP